MRNQLPQENDTPSVVTSARTANVETEVHFLKSPWQGRQPQYTQAID
jgi:hypothetical protein